MSKIPIPEPEVTAKHRRMAEAARRATACPSLVGVRYREGVSVSDVRLEAAAKAIAEAEAEDQ